MRNKNSSHGFTLIELLIAMALLSLLSGIGLVKYNAYNQQQVVIQVAGDLKNNLRFIQSKALSEEKDCLGALEGYEVTFGALYYRYRSRCSGGIYGLYKTYNLPSPVQITAAPNSLFFRILAQGVLINGASQIDISGYGRTESVTVSAIGQIR